MATTFNGTSQYLDLASLDNSSGKLFFKFTLAANYPNPPASNRTIYESVGSAGIAEQAASGDTVFRTGTFIRVNGSIQTTWNATTCTTNDVLEVEHWSSPATGARLFADQTGAEFVNISISDLNVYSSDGTTLIHSFDLSSPSSASVPDTTGSATLTLVGFTFSGLTIDSTDASMQRDADFDVTFSNPATTPTTGNTSLAQGGDTLTCTGITGSDPYTATFSVGDLSKQVDATGYDWTLTVDAETDTTGNIPLVIQAGWTKVDLVSPITTNASILFGVSGDTPVTGDDLEYDVTSTLDSGVSFSVAADGVWTVTEAVEGDWVTDITVDRRVVQELDGTIGTTEELVLSASTGSVIPAANRQTFQAMVGYLITQGYQGAGNETIQKWLLAEGISKKSFNEMLRDYLTGLGYNGSLPEQLRDWRNE